MKTIYPIFCSLALCHALCAVHTEAFFDGDEQAVIPTVKVLIGENVEGALIEAKGSYRVIDPNTNKELSRSNYSKRYYLQKLSDGLKWGEGYPGIYQIRIVPQTEETSVLVNGIQYKGSLEVYDVDGNVHLINEVPVEVYLKTLLTEHFGKKTLPNETLDAIAIAARTNLYDHLVHHREMFWHIDGKKTRYSGFALAHVSSAVDQAVDRTQALVMLYNNHLFPTTWTEHCGGKTADFSAIFRRICNTPEGVSAPYAELEKERYHWTYRIPLEKLEKKLDTPHIQEIALYKDTSSNKAYGIRIQGKMHARSLNFIDFWDLIGQENVRSNAFSVKLDLAKKEVSFDGYGQGHGVGICIFSASCMARDGDLAPQILATFYPFASLALMPAIPEHLYHNNNIIFDKR